MAAKVGLFPSSSLTTSPHAIAAAPTNAPRPRGARGLASPGRSAAAMDAFHVSSQAAEPLLRTTGAAAAAAAAATATSNPRLCVRTHAQGGEAPSSGGAGDGAAGKEFSWSSIILPFLFPALGGLLFGYDIGATSGACISLQSVELSGTTWFSLSSIQLGLVASGSLYGALGGSLLAYRVADFLGRRIELVTAAALYISGALVTGFAPDFVLLIIGRLLYGIGIGLAMHGAPLYIAETSPSRIRGTLISLKELFIVLGILTGYLVGSLEIDVVGGWRYMFGFGAPLAVIMAIGMWNLPPSPRWLLLRAVQGKASVEDNKKKAIQALRSLRGRFRSDRVLADEIDDTLLSIKAAYAEQESEGNIWKMFEGASLKALIIGGGLVLFQQITGQPSVLYYATSILQTAGFAAASDAAKVSILIGLFKLLMTGVAVFKVDDLGRRPLLIGGIGGIAVSLFLLAAYYKILNSFPFVAVGALLLYVGSYQVSFGPISWLMVSEIFPLRTRGRGISLAVLTNFGSNALVTFAFSPLQEFLGPANIFLLFGAISLLSLVFVILKVPETKGLNLEEIESKLLK
ncbi:D-xylose-proton symporter-like 3, chloroplastic [Oryza glaberrima]|uniref:D-xylose-proton symporter-like 3, chloroplastic n=1 Tax=Oryza glaberrima TaxID=4538 RepID=UPI00224C30D7|nr:D-xylose-proton symporter-like 3, chloroplastic [Oryza glaberrima]